MLYPLAYPRHLLISLTLLYQTSLGIGVPTSIGMVAGCVVSFALNNKPEWSDTYNNDGIGFLIQEVLYPKGFAKFLLV